MWPPYDHIFRNWGLMDSLIVQQFCPLGEIVGQVCALVLGLGCSSKVGSNWRIVSYGNWERLVTMIIFSFFVVKRT